MQEIDRKIVSEREEGEVGRETEREEVMNISVFIIITSGYYETWIGLIGTKKSVMFKM